MSKPLCNCLYVRLSDEVHYFVSVSIGLKFAFGRRAGDGADFHPMTCSLSYSGD